MIETVKDTNFVEGLNEAHKQAIKAQKPVLFSSTVCFDVRDVLPLLTHPSDKNTIRIFWEHPSRGFAYAGLGTILKFQQRNINDTHKIKEQILDIMKKGISLGDNSLIGPRMIGGFAFSQYEGRDTTWRQFPRAQFHLPECLATLTDDGAWLTISRLIKPDDKSENLSEAFKQTISYYENRLPVTLPPISKVNVDKYRDIPTREEYNQTIFSVLGHISCFFLCK